MKLIVIFSIITIVACGVPEVFKKTDPKDAKGANCFCRDKTCTDVSCEEKNCFTLNKALSELEDKCTKYPKKWVSSYRQFTQERCLCIKGCETICSPTEFSQCSSAAFDRFDCRYQSYLSGIIHDKGIDDFMADINRVQVTAINNNCKPICSGNGDCNPFYEEPEDCGCTQKCIEKLIKSLANSLKDENAKVILEEFLIYCNAYYTQYALCKKSPKEGQKKVCLSMCKAEIDRAFEDLQTEMTKSIGSCSASGIISALKQGAWACVWKKK